MKEMIKRVREEKGGFTLAELLIVVAIILVLVAIAIPVFTNAQNSAADATAKADIRAVRAQASVDYLLKGTTGNTPAFYKGSIDAEGNLTVIKGAIGPATTLAEVTALVKANTYPIDIVVSITGSDIDQPTKP
ncbi:MAG: prepilin-type N-terminal cleavage/methylation domain-containing protein [Gordonibacter sp.]